MRLFPAFLFVSNLLAATLPLNAQIPAWQMPHDSTSRWNTIITTNLGPGNPGPTWRFERFVVGDSVFGNHTYSVIHQDFSSTPWQSNTPSIVDCNQFCALMRSDSGKVYLKTYNDTTERLIFDFNLQVGQTFGNYSSASGTVHKIDSVYVNGQIRRKFIDTIYNAALIEGVGDNMYGFWWPEGFCSYKEGDSLYSNNISLPSGNCAVGFTGCTPLSVPETGNTNISISPNPARSFVQITANTEFENGTVVYVYTINGRLAKTCVLNGSNSQTIDLTGLSPGFYLLRLDGHIKKLIIQPD